MKLRTLSIGFVSLMVMLLGCMSLALIRFQIQMKKDTQHIVDSVHGVYAGQKLAQAIRKHNRETLLYGLTANPINHEKAQAAERQIASALRETQEHLDNEGEKALSQKVVASVDSYLSKIKIFGLQVKNPTLIYQRASDWASEVSDRIEEFNRLNVDQAEAIYNEVDATNTSALRWTAVFMSLSLAAMTAFFWFASRVLYFPLRAIKESISRYASGDESSRAPEVGPIEIRETAGVFNHMAEKLAEQKEMQLRFVAAIAHDLRNPLTAIQTSVEFLTQKGSAHSDPAELLAIIRRQVNNLDSMVGDLLDRSRIELGQMELTPQLMDLRQLVADAVDIHRASSSIHQLKLRLPEEPVRCYCDGSRMSQVLNNLISNAIKYSPHGGAVIVTLAQTADAVVLSVSDQGIGIKTEDLARIFEPFRRSSATRDTIPGVGLGLSVVKQLVQAHHGFVEVESKPGRGTVFRVHLPLAQNSAAMRALEAGQVPVPQSFR